MQLLLALTIAHFISDFMLQGNAVGSGKYGFNYYMLIHVTTTVLAALVPLLLFRITPSQIATSLLLIFATHLAIDAGRSMLNRHFHLDPTKSPFWALLGIDQILHILALYLVTSRIIVG